MEKLNKMNKFLFSQSACSRILRRYSSLSATPDTALKKRPSKKPFIKNLLAGFYDVEFLIYPELTSEKLKVVENKYLSLPKSFSNFRESLNQISAVSSSNNIDSNNLDDSKNTFCELTRLSEAIPSPSLSLLNEIHKVCVSNILSKHCSEEQKIKYLPSLLKGEKSVAFALSEENSGSDPSSLYTLAVRDRESPQWTVNGVKSWVTNAESADLFLVFSKYKLHEKSPGTNDLSVFLVEKNTPGIQIEKISTYGLEDCGIGKLTLNNVKLSDDTVLGNSFNNGYNVAVELLSSYKYSFATGFSTQLKNLLNDTIKFLSPRKQLLTDLKDCESIRKKLSDVFLTIYILDSMLYLTAGLKDNFEIDTTLESAIIHLFCIQNGMDAVDKCMEMLGSRAYDKSLPYFKIRRDLKASTAALQSKDICKMYIALTGIQHAVSIVNEDVQKLRNAFNFPLNFVKKIVSNRRHYNDSPKLNLKLYMNLHPSLQASSNQLEYCVLRLQYCVESLLIRHGSEISKRQLDLERIADILVDVYSMTAALGRASRSYCTGVKFADDEVLLAKTFCQDAFSRCKVTVNSIVSDDVIANDLFHFKVANHLFQHGGYFIEHPLTQNIG